MVTIPLYGPDSNTTWNITGEDAGNIEGAGVIDFAGVENLTGADDNQDTFVFEAAGSISGFIEGGDAGFDSLALNGDQIVHVAYTSTGFGSGTVERDSDVITYFGLEPLVDAMGGSRSFSNASPGDDTIRITDVGDPDDNRFAVYIDTAGKEDVVFTNASGITSLSVNSLDGDDTIVLDALDSLFDGDIILDAGLGDDDITVNAITGSGSYTINGGGGTGDLLRFEGTDVVTLSDSALLDLDFARTDVNVTQREGTQAETSIAVNPTDPNNIIIGSNDFDSDDGAPLNDSVWVTKDGGKKWVREKIPVPVGTSSSGDPTIVFNRAGRAVYAHVVFGNTGERTLAAAVSDDKGDSWTHALITAAMVDSINDDKPYLAVGPDYADPNLAQDRFVIAWMANNKVFISTSTDGLNWNDPILVSDEQYTLHDPVPAIGPNGEIYVVWENASTVDEGVVMFDATKDGGATWLPDNVPIYTGSLSFGNDGFEGSFYHIPAQPERVVLMGLSIDVDRSGGPNNGRIYVSFADQKDQDGDSSTAHDDLDIFVLASDDFKEGSGVDLADQGSKPWDAHGGTGAMGSLRVSREPGEASQFLAWLDVDQSNGNVAVSWHDARNDTAGAPNNTNGTPNDQVEYFASISIDGGRTWSANVPVSDGVSTGGQADSPLIFPKRNFMEYSALALADGSIYMAWADNSNVTGDNPDSSPIRMDVYYDRVVMDALRLDQIERAAITADSEVHTADFTGQLISLTGVPDWVAQGPGPITGGGVTGITDQPVTGAIESLAIDPSDLKRIYLATTGGGVWRNNDITVLFDFDQSTLTTEVQTKLTEFAEFLRENPTLSVKVVGHTDAAGTEVVNKTRSEERALAVKNFLIGQGIAASRLDNSGHRLVSNERLEFLGDAILGAIVCELLYRRFPDYLEGDLTKIKSIVVSRVSCAKLSESLGFQECLILGKGMAQNSDLPASLLADVFESLVAAIYLDGGNSEVRGFVEATIGPEIELAEAGELEGNFKSLLQQLAQREFGSTPVYQLLDEKGPDHAKCFQVAAQVGGRRYEAAWGRNKKEAEQRAASNALAEIVEERPPCATD